LKPFNAFLIFKKFDTNIAMKKIIVDINKQKG